MQDDTGRTTGELEPLALALTHCPPLILEQAATLEGRTRNAQYLDAFRVLEGLLSRVQLRQWWWTRDPSRYPPFVRCDWPHPVVLGVQGVNFERASITLLTHDPPFETLDLARVLPFKPTAPRLEECAALCEEVKADLPHEDALRGFLFLLNDDRYTTALNASMHAVNARDGLMALLQMRFLVNAFRKGLEHPHGENAVQDSDSSDWDALLNAANSPA
jgi:hypothetical protein